MLHQLSATFGSRDMLDSIIAQNPDRQLVLMADSGGDEGLQLVDVSDQPSVFKSNLDYQVQLHQGSQLWQGFFNFNYFTLDPDAAKVFTAKANRFASNGLPSGMTAFYVLTKQKSANEYVLLTIWADSQAYSLWRHSPAFTPFDVYSTSANHFHAASYQQVTAEKDPH